MDFTMLTMMADAHQLKGLRLAAISSDRQYISSQDVSLAADHLSVAEAIRAIIARRQSDVTQPKTADFALTDPVVGSKLGPQPKKRVLKPGSTDYA